MVAYSRLLSITLLAGLASCRNGPTAPSVIDIQRAQVEWQAHNLTRYAYQFETIGGNNALAGQAIRLVVLGDTVRSAQLVATNGSIPVDFLPTIDALFALAIARREDGTLVAVQFDSTFSFPTRLQISGPPDASGVILASHIELLP